jgi:hypothetical protein
MPKIPVILNADPSNYVEYTTEQLIEYERRRYKKRNNGEEPTKKQLTKIMHEHEMEMIMFSTITSNDEYDLERTDPIMVSIVQDSSSRLTIKWIPAEFSNYYAIIQPNKDDWAEEIVFHLDKYRKDNPDDDQREFNLAYICDFDSNEDGDIYSNSSIIKSNTSR